MRQYCENLYEQLQESLAEVVLEKGDSPLARAQKSIRLTKNYLGRLKDHLTTYTFCDEKEEIHFFKYIFPDFYSQLIFYIRQAEMEASVPEGGNADQRQFYQAELLRIRQYFDRHIDIYKYYRMQSTYLDDLYFLRRREAEEIPEEEYCVLYDQQFYTKMTYPFAKIRAHELLRDYIQGRLDELDGKQAPIPHPLQFKLKKVFLAELIFALEATGAFGNLKTRLIADTIATDWNCPISNIYKTYEEICIRKKERFPFLQMLLANAQRRSDEFFDR